MTTEAVIALAALCFTVFGSLMAGTAWLTWWLSKELSATRKAVYDKVDDLDRKFGEKMDYHEAHDDQRFSEVTNVLAAARLELSVGLAGKANRA